MKTTKTPAERVAKYRRLNPAKARLWAENYARNLRAKKAAYKKKEAERKRAIMAAIMAQVKKEIP